MRVIYSGTEFPHKNGEFCNRRSFHLYGVFYFYTPFLFEKDGQLLRGEAGDLLIIEPGDIVYHGPISKEQSFINDWFYVTNDFSVLLKRYPIPCGIRVKVGNQKIIDYAIKTITAEFNKKGIGYEEKIDCVLTQMMIDLYRAYQNYGKQSGEMRIQSVYHRIMQSPERDWTLEEMAKLSGYSASHFSAVWAKHYGCSPKAALLQKRLDMAEQLLVCTHLSIGEIAERCGFQSIYYFSKCFKKYRGLSPRDFSHAQLANTVQTT